MRLFRKKIEKACALCAHCTKLDESSALCIKKGVVSLDSKCRKFTYEPTKRIPKKMKTPDFDKYSQEDFSL